ncbi:MAG: NADH-quinone oxidoreductase subunit NuoG [Magnetococcales bacterium]|nr:NADH-quinone oxidoreductase subunit NuoG [Magnetococcales bacterium]
MPTLIIDDREITVKPGTTIMEAARSLGIEIPHFCYHPSLSIAGNCRMCMVEVEKMPKPVISCAMPVNDGMVVRTNSEMVVKARRGVMEFLLINHPLDCPVCDQGGECKLQDYAVKYGPDRSRFQDKKRTVPNYDLGPVIETEMNRCIHCTRCIRFSTEVAGVEEMGAIFRGDHMKVGPCPGHGPLTSVLAGNLAELCPVGALNLKPFHFQARGWELSKTEGICEHCAVGCHIRVDSMENRIYRIMSRQCSSINLDWLCDKGRFAFEGMTEGRLQVPMMVPESGGPQVEVTWNQALDRVAALIQGVAPEEVAGLAGSWGQGGEELYAFQDFLRHVVGTPHLDHRLLRKDFSPDSIPLLRADLMLNTPLQDMERADAVFLIGAGPRFEMPLLNLRLRKASLNGASVWSLGPRHLLSKLENLEEAIVLPGEEADFLRKVLNAMTTRRGPKAAVAWANALRKAQRPVFLLGRFAVNHPNAETLRRLVLAVLGKAEAVEPGWNGYNRMISGNGAGAHDLGVVPQRGPGYTKLGRRGMNAREIFEQSALGKIKVLFLMGLDMESDTVVEYLAAAAQAGTKIIFQGAFHSAAVDKVDVVLPGLVHGEKFSTLTNCEGRVQRSGRVVHGPIMAKEDWRILRALSQRFPQELPYDNLQELWEAMGREDRHYDPAVVDSGEIPKACDHGVGLTEGLECGAEVDAEENETDRLVLILEPSFYRDTPMSRRSSTMTKLDGVEVLRISGKEAKKHKIVAGDRVCIECNGHRVEVRTVVDERVKGGVLLGTREAMRELGGEKDGFLQVTLKVL